MIPLCSRTGSPLGRACSSNGQARRARKRGGRSMAREPVVLIHGYSDKGESFRPWAEALVQRGYTVDEVSACTYRSLTNEVTIKDVAEAFDRALQTLPHLQNGEPFNAIVHSTGMLVLRNWMTTYAARRDRLKRLIGLAPATFGSPLAHKGRGFLGAIFKGNKEIGPDFLEAGDLILDSLELGSRYTWDMTAIDLLGEQPFYSRGGDTPYVFVFCGTDSYPGIRQLANEPGTDGTVRWAGCSLNTRKFILDFARDQARDAKLQRVRTSDTPPEGVLPIPFWPIAGRNHTTIVSQPRDMLVDLVHHALQVDSPESFAAWEADAREKTADATPDEKWQQFVVRAVDERDDPVTDYHVELFLKKENEEAPIDFDLDVHAYRADPSLRCFHVNLNRLQEARAKAGEGQLWARIIASSGSVLVGYHGINSEKLTFDLRKMNREGVWDAKVALPDRVDGVELFYPFTTTFIELRLNRDPMPFGEIKNEICWF